MAKTNKNNLLSCFVFPSDFLLIFICKTQSYRVKDVDSTRGQTVSVPLPLAILYFKEVRALLFPKCEDSGHTLQWNHLKCGCKCVCKQLKPYLRYLSSCSATFLAISGTGNPSCSMYFVSVIISWSLGEKFTRNWTLFSVVTDSSVTEVYNRRKQQKSEKHDQTVPMQGKC